MSSDRHIALQLQSRPPRVATRELAVELVLRPEIRFVEQIRGSETAVTIRVVSVTVAVAVIGYPIEITETRVAAISATIRYRRTTYCIPVVMAMMMATSVRTCRGSDEDEDQAGAVRKNA